MTIVYISDPRVLAIPIQECNEPLIDLKDQNDIQYGPVPETELSKNNYTKLRKTVFEKLCAAQKNLPNNWKFRVYECYRSREVQKTLFDQEYQHILARYPNETDPKKLFHETTRLVSPVINFEGSLNIPAHNTGAAVDIEIIDTSNQLIDMGMAAKDWMDVDPDLCLTNNSKLSNALQSNRRVLFDVMIEQGFVNYPTEWWHFSYGDRYWAYHQKEKYALYGSSDDL